MLQFCDQPHPSYINGHMSLFEISQSAMTNFISCLLFAKFASSATYTIPYSPCFFPATDICSTGQICRHINYTGFNPFFSPNGAGYFSVTLWPQCLPVNYTSSTMIFDESTSAIAALLAFRAISNSIGDDPGPVNGALAGCGSGLQGISLLFGLKHECVPFVKNGFYTKEARLHQTCGASTPQNRNCSSSLQCTPVTAIIKGVVTPNGKNICLDSVGLRKRVVSANGAGATYLYSVARTI